MIKEMYIIKDTINKVVSPIFTVASKIAAIREFVRVVARVNKNCRCDYELSYLGTFDDDSLAIVPADEVVTADRGDCHTEDEYAEALDEQKK